LESLAASGLIDVQLEPHDDEFRWRLTQTGKFTVKSMYLDLLNGITIYLHKYLWKMKVPLKTKIFMWFVQRKEILTKDNLLKRNWLGSTKCCFCDHDESIQHLFYKLPFCINHLANCLHGFQYNASPEYCAYVWNLV
jgi:hypothetical protein